MDFFSAEAYTTNQGNVVSPIFNSRRVKDFMTRGRAFYAVFDEETGLWTKEEGRVYEIIDDALTKKKDEFFGVGNDIKAKVYWMNRYRMRDSNAVQAYTSWVKLIPDNYRPLDQKVTYLSQETTLKDYASKRLPYDLEDGEPEAYNEIMSTIYEPKERRKLEWALGAILNGDVSLIQKMMVLFGPPGSGKSTFLHILEQVLEGYTTTFDVKSLVTGKDFSTHFFKENPLVAIQHDAVLNKIEDNTVLNTIISHEPIVVNEKHKAQYVDKANCMLFVGTNSPVKITDAKSGLIRRVIDVNPTGNKVPENRYLDLMERIPFELGKIANKCIKVYRHFGKFYYLNYRPLQMMKLTDAFFNFVLDQRLMLEKEDPIDLQRIYDVYKNYCDVTKAAFITQRYKFRNELENYYESYDKKTMLFSGFKAYLLDEEDPDKVVEESNESKPRWIVLDQRESIFDKVCSSCPAQYGNKDEIPFDKWENVTRTLSEIDTSKLHYVKVPENHVVIDFDLKNEKGEKDPTLNLDAANKFPPTYAEYSKGGSGIHLHYIYGGDLGALSRIYSEDGIEIKVFTGNSSLRRKLTFCNNLPIAHISSGLPLKEDKKLISEQIINDEKHLRNLIKKCLRKEIHAYTKPSVDYIYKLLDDAYKSGMHYDVRDLRGKVLTFAMGSTNQKDACLKLVNEMKFCSEEASEAVDSGYVDERIVPFDVEIFPNLFLVCWKFHGDPDDAVVSMINPSSKDVADLMKYKLAAFNGRSYDGHMLYGAYLGYSVPELYRLSQNIIVNRTGFFREGYNVCYMDPYDYSVKKQGLKKWEIELGIHHQELPFDWDKPVPKDKWPIVAEYCANDVNALDEVITTLKSDFIAREMLAKVANKPIITPTNSLTRQIIFQGNRNPTRVYTDFTTGVSS